MENSESCFYTLFPDSFDQLYALFRSDGFMLAPSVDLFTLRTLACARRWESLDDVCKFLLLYMKKEVNQ